MKIVFVWITPTTIIIFLPSTPVDSLIWSEKLNDFIHKLKYFSYIYRSLIYREFIYLTMELSSITYEECFVQHTNNIVYYTMLTRKHFNNNMGFHTLRTNKMHLSITFLSKDTTIFYSNVFEWYILLFWTFKSWVYFFLKIIRFIFPFWMHLLKMVTDFSNKLRTGVNFQRSQPI